MKTKTFVERLQTEINEARAQGHVDYANALERGLQFRQELPLLCCIDRKQVIEQSTWKTLKMIMVNNKGILVVNDAVSFFTEIKAFTGREQARHIIYSTIHNHRHELNKIRPGIYQPKQNDTTTIQKAKRIGD